MEQPQTDRQMRRTSIEAYIKIKESGTITALQCRVLDYLSQNPNHAARECADRLWCGIQSISGRFTELEAMGLIRESGHVLIGNHTHTTWEMTGNTIPIKKNRSENLKCLHRFRVFTNIVECVDCKAVFDLYIG